MYFKKPKQPNYRSYLSPQTLRNYPIVQSPKFNGQKALFNQKERIRINEEKLSRFDQYNSMLAVKATLEFSPNKQKVSLQKNIVNFNQKQRGTKTLDINGNDKKKSFVTVTYQNAKRLKNQVYLQQLRQKNHNLHKKSSDLNLYLKEITSGVTELQCILQEVELTERLLKQAQPQFNGLWILNDQEQDEQVSYQKQTNVTLQSDSIRFGSPNKLKEKFHKKESDNFDRLEEVEMLQVKFKQILQKIQQRSSKQYKKSTQLNELNAIQKQIDRLKQLNSTKTFHSSNQTPNFPKQSLSNAKSQYPLQISKYIDSKTIPKPLSKVKSLQKIFQN